MHELVIYTDTPWEEINDVDIISVMADLYNRGCPYSLMRKVFSEYENGDKALVYCGTFDDCKRGQEMFLEREISAIVLGID